MKKRNSLVPLINFISPENKLSYLKEKNIDIRNVFCAICQEKINIDNLAAIKIDKESKKKFICSSCLPKAQILSDIILSYFNAK